MVQGGTKHTSVRSYALYVKDVTDNSNIFSHYAIPFVDDVDSTPFTSWGIIIYNDNGGAGASIEFSFDGTTVHGEVKATQNIPFNARRATQIYLRSSSVSNFRVFAW